MTKLSAGILLYKIAENQALSVLIVHPGGPFWAKKDEGVWSIPKGEYSQDEDAWEAAQREFKEELGLTVPVGEAIELGSQKQSSGKIITAWAIQSDLDVSNFKGNTLEIDWPPRSSKKMTIPEVDKAEWVSLATARQKLNKGQVAFLDRLIEQLGGAVNEGKALPRPQTLF